jgi:hypothetical protein
MQRNFHCQSNQDEGNRTWHKFSLAWAPPPDPPEAAAWTLQRPRPGVCRGRRPGSAAAGGGAGAAGGGRRRSWGRPGAGGAWVGGVAPGLQRPEPEQGPGAGGGGWGAGASIWGRALVDLQRALFLHGRSAREEGCGGASGAIAFSVRPRGQRTTITGLCRAF